MSTTARGEGGRFVRAEKPDTTGRTLGLEQRMLILQTYAQYERYLPSPQDVHQYRRKAKEFIEQIAARWPATFTENGEGGAADGRDDGGSAD